MCGFGCAMRTMEGQHMIATHSTHQTSRQCHNWEKAREEPARQTGRVVWNGPSIVRYATSRTTGTFVSWEGTRGDVESTLKQPDVIGVCFLKISTDKSTISQIYLAVFRTGNFSGWMILQLENTEFRRIFWEFGGLLVEFGGYPCSSPDEQLLLLEAPRE